MADNQGRILILELDIDDQKYINEFIQSKYIV